MKRFSSVITALALATSLVLPMAASAQPTALRLNQDDRPARSGTIDSPLRAKTGPVKIVIEFADEAGAQALADAQARGQSAQAALTTAKQRVAQIDQAQRQILPALSQVGASVIYRTQRVYNGIAVTVDASKLQQIARLPHVKALHLLVPKHLDNASSVPLIGAPSVWNSAGPNATGTNIKLGIIDSGIDYIHTDFGGSGLAADYTRNITNSLSDGLFPSARVVGGYDFVGDQYDASNAPVPDPDPMDCAADKGNTEGHGTHVAGTAAGSGVNADGTTYTGTYGPGTNFGSLKIGPGVAPTAKLYALRVFGCNGSTDVVDQALEWASDPNGDGNMADHLDVVNMSLGSDFGSIYDSTTIASENAVKAGVIVVASAGNSGDTNYVIGSPSTGDSVISVASTADATDITDAFRVEAPAPIAGVYPASRSANFAWETPPATSPLPVTANLYYPATNQSGCVAWTGTEATNIAGKIVLVDWRKPGEVDFPCGSGARSNNAFAAGAKGIIMVDNTPYLATAIAGNDKIPAMYTISTVGDTLKSKLTAGTPSNVSVTLSAEFINTGKVVTPTRNDTLSDFSSRGTRRGGVLKPDIAAPGQSIFSARSGFGSQGQTLSGTSMAAPHIAGSMALLRQLHPTWTVAELKALAMNTADKDVRSDLDASSPIYGPSRVGAGRVDLTTAAAGTVLVYNKASPSLVSVSFGTVEVTSTASLAKQVTVVNKGAASATYNVSYTPTSVIPGVTYVITPPQVTVAAGASVDLTVTMSADASKMKHSHDPTLSESQADDDRHWISEAQGYLTLAAPATTAFSAHLNANFEVPTATSDVSALADVTYAAATKALGYTIKFTAPFTATMGHIHSGIAGTSGPVIHPLPTLPTNATSLSGSVTLTAAEETLLLSGGLYFNFHTIAYPSGEIRGQIVPKTAALRLPIYAAARPASAMKATASKLALTGLSTAAQTTAISLAGTAVNTGDNTPVDEKSIVTAYTLQYISPQIVASKLISSSADLQYVGVTSNYTTTLTSNTSIYFGVATYGDWATPSTTEFDIYIDTNRDGTDDYVLYNTYLPIGADQSDVFVSKLVNLTTNKSSFQDYINFVPASVYNTVPFNTNVLAIPVAASALGLTIANTSFSYSIYTYTSDDVDTIDSTPTLKYNVASPTVHFTGGIAGLPVYLDAPATTIPVVYNRSGNFSDQAKGVLLLHHHNTSGNRAEAVTTPSLLALPIIFRK